MGSREYVVYEETAVWPWWAATVTYLAAGGGVVVGILDVLQGLATGRPDVVVRGALIAVGALALGVALQVVLGRLRVTVSRTSVLLTYGYTGLVQKLVSFEEIEDVEPVRYSPVREFGGWGIRFGGGGRKAWTIRGDGAVVLTLDNGTRFYVGSERPERLAGHIRTAMARSRRRETEESSVSNDTGEA